MTWQRMIYGTLVVAGLSIVGTTIYKANRHYTAAIDLAVLVESTLEHQAAARTSLPVLQTVTQQVTHWITDPSGLQYTVPNGTNAPTLVNYLVASGSNALATNYVRYGLQVGQTFRRQVGRTTNDAPAYVDESWDNVVGVVASRAMCAALDGAIKALVPSYLDRLDATNGPVMLTVTGLWARLQIGDGTNKFSREPAFVVPAHTNWVYSYVNWFPNQTASSTCYTAEAWRAVNYASAWSVSNGYTFSVYSNAAAVLVPETNTAATFGDLPWQMYTNDFMERWRVLCSLTCTVVTATWVNGVGDSYSTNQGMNYSFHEFPPSTTNVMTSGDGTFNLPFPDGYPADWIHVEVGDTTGPFFEPAASRDFSDQTFGAHTAITNGTAAPIYSYSYEFSFSRLQQYYSLRYGGMSGDYTLQEVQASQANVDRSDYLRQAACVEAALPYMPTGVSATVDFHLEYSAITNPASADYSVTGSNIMSCSYTWAAEGCATVTTEQVASDYIDITTPTSFAIDHDGVGFSLGGPYGQQATFTALHECTNGGAFYYGTRVDAGPAVVHWNFIYK